MKTNSGKKGEGMPVVRNPQFYFREGFCWNNVLNPEARLLKVKIKQKSVNDVGSMALTSNLPTLPSVYFVGLLNSNLLFDYYREFVNCSVNIQINDIRQMPIVIPSDNELDALLLLINDAIELKTQNQDDLVLKIEERIDAAVRKLYRI